MFPYFRSTKTTEHTISAKTLTGALPVVTLSYIFSKVFASLSGYYVRSFKATHQLDLRVFPGGHKTVFRAVVSSFRRASDFLKSPSSGSSPYLKSSSEVVRLARRVGCFAKISRPSVFSVCVDAAVNPQSRSHRKLDTRCISPSKYINRTHLPDDPHV